MKTLIGTEAAKHVFIVQNQVGNVLGEHFGFRDTADLPPYYQPTAEGREISGRILDLILQPDAHVEIVFYEENVCLKGVACIIGPRNLGEIVGDTEGPQSYLWRREPVDCYYECVNKQENINARE